MIFRLELNCEHLQLAEMYVLNNVSTGFVVRALETFAPKMHSFPAFSRATADVTDVDEEAVYGDLPLKGVNVCEFLADSRVCALVTDFAGMLAAENVGNFALRASEWVDESGYRAHGEHLQSLPDPVR